MSDMPPQSSLSPLLAPAGDPDYINLTLLSPSTEIISGGRMSYPCISLDTTISQLRARIENDLPARPPSQKLRLIYRGHPLTAGEATLRQILRGPQPRHSPDLPSDYTIHLILPINAPINPPAAAPVPSHGIQQDGRSTQAHRAIPTPTTTNPIPGVAHDTHDTHNAFHQLNQLQQQVAGNNQIPNAMQMGYQLVPPHMQHMLPDQNAAHGQNLPQLPPAFFPGAPSGAHLQALLARQQMMRAQAGMHAMHNQNPIHNQNQIHAQNTTQPPQPTNLSEAPVTRVQESIGPNGERITTTITEMNFQQTLPPTTTTTNSTTTAPETRSDTPSAHIRLPAQAGMARSRSAENANPLRTIHRHLPHPFAAQQTPAPTPTAQTTAWLLSSPSGPQALLFAPGHGYFASPSTQTAARLAPTRSSRQRPTTRSPPAATSTALVQQPQAPPAAENAPDAAPVQFDHPPRHQDPDPNAHLNHLIQRAWLFVRLYMFTFVLSDSGTWRRYLLLAFAFFVCLLPRENPFNDLFTAVRRHVDNLVGPPPPPAPAPQPGVVTTPEETAARLLRERQERSPFRATLFRIERAVALFVASLVPGVGERHVRAREEVRRLVTEEQERIAREERERREAENRPV